ncbi:unnamed protein product [Didymodactylos carnosus]|uniref:NAD(P)(+)--arginine ADP-ribosyltransferase n=1 Tax=Didymodactylos carnosus TaxID=1234261 RepID=A0A814U660_9BILA|nr:unnamed protein product [Didymodactylos carnosus]CAF1167743.1 unnamed protein product [Didymodactylos carnosus]CAF3745345.1 unnamed protein product [Didymodactylos carnosus]CAF3931374.1 unnamed protein product [Didymodactylos carnosus]
MPLDTFVTSATNVVAATATCNVNEMQNHSDEEDPELSSLSSRRVPFIPELGNDNNNGPNANLRYIDVYENPSKLLLPINGYQDYPLVTLEEAIAPVQCNLDKEIMVQIYIAKQNCRKPMDGLTQDESAAIHLYSFGSNNVHQSFHYVLNQTLRMEDRTHLKPWFLYLKLILSGLWKLPSAKCMVWRGIKKNLSDQYIVGNTVVWWGFSSCTTSAETLESEQFLGKTGTRTLFSIECTNGKVIRNHSYYERENEVLLLPATQFEVVGKVSPAIDLFIIHLRETPPPFPFLQSPVYHSDSPGFTIPTVPLAAEEVTGNVGTYKLYDQSVNADDGDDDSERPTTDMLDSLRPPPPPSGMENLLLEDLENHFVPLTTRSVMGTMPEVRCSTGGRAQSPPPRPTVELHKIILHIKNNTTVDLSMKQIFDDDLTIIAEELKTNRKCTRLTLSSNQITDDGIRVLSHALKGKTNTTLKMLILSSNKIADNSAQYIANMLKGNNTIELLDLSDNEITNSGMEFIAATLKTNTTLKRLYLNDNKISDDGFRLVLHALKRNRALTHLNISGNQLSREFKKTFDEQLSKGNQTLKTVYL